MADFKYVTSERGGKLLLVDNFIYRSHSTRGQTRFYRCAADPKCKGRALVKESGTLVTVRGFHNHGSATQKIERKMFIESLKKRIEEQPNASVPRIYEQQLQETSSHARWPDLLPSYESISTTLYRYKHHLLGRPKPPQNRKRGEYLIIPENEIKFIRSHRGGTILAVNNFLYRMHLTKGQTTFWRCATEVKCKGRVSIKDGVMRQANNSFHCHEPQTQEIEKRLFQEKLKKRVTMEPLMSVPKIYKEELEAASSSTSKLPTYLGIATTLYRARASGRLYNTLQGHSKEQNKDSPLSDNEEEIIPPECLERTYEGHSKEEQTEDSPLSDNEEEIKIIPPECLERTCEGYSKEEQTEDSPLSDSEEEMKFIPPECLERTGEGHIKEAQTIDFPLSDDEEEIKFIPPECLERTFEGNSKEEQTEDSPLSDNEEEMKFIPPECLERTYEGHSKEQTTDFPLFDNEEEMKFIPPECLERTCEEKGDE